MPDRRPRRHWPQRFSAKALERLTAVMIIIAVIAGGASRDNAMRLAVVELAGLLLAAAALRTRPAPNAPARPSLGLTLLFGAAAAIPVIQSLLLPPEIWMRLPGQAPRIRALALAGVQPPWAPISLTPDLTWRALLALIPPASMSLAVTRLDRDATRRLMRLWLIAAACGLGLGLAQISGAGAYQAYPYAYTNLGSVVGFFANRNHEAAFLLALTPAAAALLAHRNRAAARHGGSIFRFAAMLFLPIALVALAVIHSRAGVLLAPLAAAFCTGIILRSRRGRTRSRTWTAGLAIGVGLAAAAVAVFGLDPILQRFDSRLGPEFRFEVWPVVTAEAWAHMPFGAGLGAFERVHLAAEPLAFLGPTYLNHAHNDPLELWLEAGMAGLALMAGALAWLARRSLHAWRGRGAQAQAAAAGIVMLLAASTVDYPLRTETLAVLMAFYASILAGTSGSGS